ncbi:MAG: acyl-CoA dehydrogenase [Actinomycetia bacterium]|nr:acyl-CoA dehydrogenase [Actinomycetes bacterium]MCP4961042.1 acyl-CoA dehydrogenase [Actinomycetes bacterium]
MSTTEDDSPEAIETEIAAWIEQNWNPDATVAQWWERLADAGLAHPMLSESAGGRGYSRPASQAVSRALAAAKVLGPPTGLGAMLAAPTIASHGTPEQIDRFVRPILTGQQAWCQLFSEPGAGSDLAGLNTKADRDGDEFVVNGQKVWTSGGQIADMGMLIARTDPDAPKHKGVSYFAIDMNQPGIEVRPLREMTGRAMFNEVFLTDAVVGADAAIGGLNDGWRVANTTLTWERASLGVGSVSLAQCVPGQIAGNLGRKCGDVVASAATGVRGAGGVGIGKGLYDHLVGIARSNGSLADPVLRQRIVGLFTLLEINRLNALRAKDPRQRTGGEGNIGKLQMSEQFRQFREVGLSVIGADGMLADKSSATGGLFQGIALFSPGPAIYGGTDQVQRNIIGERVLGLPREPGPGRDTPFRDLPKNG